MVIEQRSPRIAMPSADSRGPKKDPLHEKLSDKARLRGQLSEAIAKLEGGLKDDARALRADMESTIESVSGGGDAPLKGFGMRFTSPSGESIELKSGEVDSPDGKSKMAQIIDKTISLARGDLAFLKAVDSALEEGRNPTDSDLGKVIDILDGNLYWRFTKPF